MLAIILIGGPLLVDGVQVGIVSWSVKPCTIAPYPGKRLNAVSFFFINHFAASGVYTGVSHYIDWIIKTTGLKFRLNAFLRASN